MSLIEMIDSQGQFFVMQTLRTNLRTSENFQLHEHTWCSTRYVLFIAALLCLSKAACPRTTSYFSNFSLNNNNDHRYYQQGVCGKIPGNSPSKWNHK
ncbi:unnamed protein product [Allacma fusca]|uniref:Uncharacterized protein n=1 Tax=Allacma fusca TaxID=39272 RepID=A0A8J2PU26_9HEXA|nr:unnamed protein product [Allacma fusca]